MRLILLSIIAIAAIAAAATFTFMHHLMPPPAELDLARSRPTDRGTYIASIEPEAGQIPQNEVHNWVVTLNTVSGSPVENAEIAVDGGMPQHGHGLPSEPYVASYLGDGRYSIENVVFSMTGWWEITLSIAAPEGDDEITFNLLL